MSCGSRSSSYRAGPRHNNHQHSCCQFQPRGPGLNMSWRLNYHLPPGSVHTRIFPPLWAYTSITNGGSTSVDRCITTPPACVILTLPPVGTATGPHQPLTDNEKNPSRGPLSRSGLGTSGEGWGHGRTCTLAVHAFSTL